jgi:hypothetical protein
MSKYLPKSSVVIRIGSSIATVLASNPAQSQSGATTETNPTATSTANNSSATVISTPVIIGIGSVVGLAILSVLLFFLKSSKSVTGVSQSKQPVSENDQVLHQRNFEKITQIANQTKKRNLDEFSNPEFITFSRIKSSIAKSIDGYANFDQLVASLEIAIATQKSYSRIDSTEIRYRSSSQQQLYDFIDSLLTEEFDAAAFKVQIEQKFQEVLPLLKSEEGKLSLEAYTQEFIKIADHPLSIKLIRLFKTHQLDEFAALQNVANIISKLDIEDLSHPDSLLSLVAMKSDAFAKSGQIIGIAARDDQSETYAKMLQYMGLKSRYDDTYQSFQKLLSLLKQSDAHYKTIANIRTKYPPQSYQLPTEFTAELPGFALYQKYADSFHLIVSDQSHQSIDIATNAGSSAERTAQILTGVN